MKKYILLFVLAVTCLSAMPPGKKWVRMTAQEARQTAESIAKSTQGIRTMQGNFTQTRTVAALKSPSVSEGKLYYERGGVMKWEYTSPYALQLTFKGDRVEIGNDKGKSTLDTGNGKTFQRVSKLIRSSLTGENLKTNRDFKVDFYKYGYVLKALMTPRKSDLKALFSEVVVSFDSQTKTLKSVEITEKNGDKTKIVFSVLRFGK